MHQKVLRQLKSWFFVWMCLALATATWVLFSGEANQWELTSASRAALRGPTGSPQLVSVEPLPAVEGELCEWLPASSQERLIAAVLQGRMGGGSGAASAEARPSEQLDRAPVRVIRDTYATFSAIAVDVRTDEVFLQDENLFGIKVFNRLDNTPPGAAFTEPKRMLGGHHTKLEFNCGLYVDPKTGDIYSVNNDTTDLLVIFPHAAQGNVPPSRELRTPHGTYGIAVDEAAQEMYLTVEHVNTVVVFRKMAEGNEKPLRAMVGPKTQLEDPHGIALDMKNGWLFVSNHGNAQAGKPAYGKFEPPSITVYPMKASGDEAPLRTIEGPKTRLNWPAHLWVDEERGEFYVANDGEDSILVFRTSDNGDVAPLRVLQGPKTQIKNPTGVFLDTKNDELWVSNMGNHRATVYARTANGDVAPKRVIRSAPAEKRALAIGNPGAVGYDSKREEILVPN
ncbi:MAG: hypothetical protein HY647_12685 [Acidobacteria bacterium]|nr:hypothetical protein [Acidobacteriota bacterium]